MRKTEDMAEVVDQHQHLNILSFSILHSDMCELVSVGQTREDKDQTLRSLAEGLQVEGPDLSNGYSDRGNNVNMKIDVPLVKDNLSFLQPPAAIYQ